MLSFSRKRCKITTFFSYMQTILAKKCILIAFFRQKVDFLEQKGAFEGQKSKVKRD
jgi:hypothetical protein